DFLQVLMPLAILLPAQTKVVKAFDLLHELRVQHERCKQLRLLALSMKLQHDKLTLATAARGYTLPTLHPTKQLVTWQVNQRVKAQSRTPLVTRATQIADERGVDLDAVSDRKLLHKEFMISQRRLFRLSGQCKLLRRLTSHPFDPGKLPMYLKHDPPRTAALRAKLRLNRTNIKSSLLRQ